MELSGLVEINITKMKLEENLTRISPAEEYYLYVYEHNSTVFLY